MYTTLFSAMTEAITLLQTAQCEAEESYISTDETVITALDAGGDVKQAGHVC